MSKNSNDVHAKCRKCDHVFVLCQLPALVDDFVTAGNKTYCPNCKAGPRHLFLWGELFPPAEEPSKTTKLLLEERFETYSRTSCLTSGPAVLVTLLRQAFIAGAAAGIGVLFDQAKGKGPKGLSEELPGLIADLLAMAVEMQTTAGAPVEVKD